MKQWRAIAAAAVFIVSGGSTSWAQGTGRFLTGPIGWTPVVSLRDAGIDSNVFDDPRNPQEDRIATLGAALDAQMTLAHFKLGSTASTDYAYFHRFATERSLMRRINVRVEAPTQRFIPLGTASYDRSKERQTPEIDVRTFRTSSSLGVGASVFFVSRAAIQLSARREGTRYDGGQVIRGVEVAGQLNRDTDSATVGVRVNVTPLTSLSLDANIGRDRFVLRPEQNVSNLSWIAAVDFAPDAVIRGRVGFGYHIMEPRGPDALAFRGYTANVDLAYVLLDRTRFNGRYFRDTSFSIEAPYFVLTTLGLEIAQAVGGPFDVLLRGNRQQSDYPENPALRIAHRVDLIDVLGAGFAVRVSDSARVTTVYELTRRQSPSELLQYERRRLITSFSYGF